MKLKIVKPSTFKGLVSTVSKKVINKTDTVRILLNLTKPNERYRVSVKTLCHVMPSTAKSFSLLTKTLKYLIQFAVASKCSEKKPRVLLVVLDTDTSMITSDKIERVSDSCLMLGTIDEMHYITGE